MSGTVNYSSNLPKPPLTPDLITTNFFNGYYNQQATISKYHYDLIKGFFTSKTKDPAAVEALTSVVITIVTEFKLDPIGIIESLKNLEGSHLSQALTLMFNSTRRNSSYLGYTQIRQSNSFVQRNILV